MASENVICVICNLNVNEKTVKFTTNILDKSKSILELRKKYNLKFKDITLPVEIDDYSGYHVKCYKNFTAVMKKYHSNKLSTLSNVPPSSTGILSFNFVFLGFFSVDFSSR